MRLVVDAYDQLASATQGRLRDMLDASLAEGDRLALARQLVNAYLNTGFIRNYTLERAEARGRRDHGTAAYYVPLLETVWDALFTIGPDGAVAVPPFVIEETIMVHGSVSAHLRLSPGFVDPHLVVLSNRLRALRFDMDALFGPAERRDAILDGWTHDMQVPYGTLFDVAHYYDMFLESRSSDALLERVYEVTPASIPPIRTRLFGVFPFFGMPDMIAELNKTDLEIRERLVRTIGAMPTEEDIQTQITLFRSVRRDFFIQCIVMVPVLLSAIAADKSARLRDLGNGQPPQNPRVIYRAPADDC
jgi:hypothetical protein